VTDNESLSSQISWVYTEDLAATCHFYGDLLGLKRARDTGTACIYQTCPNAFIGVCTAFDDRVVQPKGSMISLITNDVDGWYKMLSDAGANVQGPPHRLEQFGIYTFFARDPNGYVIEFQQFLDTSTV